MDLILVRHGQPDWTPGQKQRNDPDLTETGRRQALRVARRLAELEKVDEIWVSTMRRAAQTAEPVSRELRHDAEPHEWLEEIRNPPDWEGAPAEEIERHFADANQRDMERMWDGLPGGESFRAFHQRVVTGLKETLERHGVRPMSPAHRHLWTVEDPDRTVIIVAHAGTNAVVLGHLLGLDPVPWEWERFSQPHTGVSRLKLMPISTGWSFSLRQLGDVSHLDPDLVTV
ncbi:MAG TPA: histidine phosphatase family protein [Acidimicrobiia bacterium]